MTDTYLDRLAALDGSIVQLISVWLSGILAGELIVLVVLVNYREIRPITSAMDWSVAFVLALLSLVIPAMALYYEVQSNR